MTESSIKKMIDASSNEDDPIIYTDGSVQRGVRSGWGFVVYFSSEEI